MSAKAVASLCADELAPSKVHIAPALLEKIAHLVLDGYAATSHGGLEVGGLLFGRQDSGFVIVEEFRPLSCDHSLGPRFILSDRDERNLRDLLNAANTDPALQGLEVAGWYCSHTRSDLLLLDRELVLHDTYFAGRDDFVIIFKPRDLRNVTAGIFLRGADGTLPRCPSTILEMPELGAARHPSKCARASDESDLPGISSHPVLTAVNEHMPALSDSDHSISEPGALICYPKRKSGNHGPAPTRWKIVLAVALSAAVGSFGALRYRQLTSVRNSDVFLSLHPQAGKLILSWKSNLVRARRAHVDILDGTSREHFNLTEVFQPSGVFLFPHNSGNVQVVLTVDTGKGVVVRNAAFTDPSAVVKDAAAMDHHSEGNAASSALPSQLGNRQLTTAGNLPKHPARHLRRKRHKK
jgi:hypothetical protein